MKYVIFYLLLFIIGASSVIVSYNYASQMQWELKESAIKESYKNY